jgi:hypothetical protein
MTAPCSCHVRIQCPAAPQSCNAHLQAAASPLVKVQHPGQTCTPCSSRPCIYMHRVWKQAACSAAAWQVSSTPLRPNSSTSHLRTRACCSADPPSPGTNTAGCPGVLHSTCSNAHSTPAPPPPTPAAVSPPAPSALPSAASQVGGRDAPAPAPSRLQPALLPCPAPRPYCRSQVGSEGAQVHSAARRQLLHHLREQQAYATACVIQLVFHACMDDKGYKGTSYKKKLASR